MKTILGVMFFGVMLAAAGMCQSPSAKPVSSECSIRELIDRDGWEIPGLSKFSVSSKGERWTTDGLNGIIVDTLKSEAPGSSLLLVSCASGRTERMRVRRQSVNVMEILRFSMNGHVFAYRVTAQFMGLEGNNVRVPLASQVMITFYDEEGSGRFSVMQYPGLGLIPKLEVPEWVRSSK